MHLLFSRVLGASGVALLIVLLCVAAIGWKKSPKLMFEKGALAPGFLAGVLRVSHFWLALGAMFLFWTTFTLQREESFLDGLGASFRASQPEPEKRVQAVFEWVNSWNAVLAEERSASRDQDADLMIAMSPGMRQQAASCGDRAILANEILRRSGVPSRVLLLRRESGTARHVVVEVGLADRWVVFDPVWVSFLRDARGRLLDRHELRDPRLLREATAGFHGYDPLFTYERAGYYDSSRGALLSRAIALVSALVHRSPLAAAPRPSKIDRPVYRILFLTGSLWLLVLMTRMIWVRQVFDRLVRRRGPSTGSHLRAALGSVLRGRTSDE